MTNTQTETARRSERVVVAVTPEEKERIEADAALELLSVSDYIRRTLLLAHHNEDDGR